jgi:hypothetical protein
VKNFKILGVDVQNTIKNCCRIYLHIITNFIIYYKMKSITMISRWV